MWNLYKEDNFLEPLKFSNGKNQSDVVKEVLKLVQEGKKIIFIRGMCGTGKSAIALNIARNLGKSVIVVPGKNLQSQYKKDYEHNKYLLKDAKEKLKISVITGRNNHKCRFLEDNKNAIPVIKKEENSRLSDIFEGRREKISKDYGKDTSADNQNLPCKIELKERNWAMISQYLKQNNRVNASDFTEIRDVKRLSIAPVCPYWSPAVPGDYELKLGEVRKRKYSGIKGEFTIYQRKSGCKFYEQFNDYIDSDVIVFNSQKYKLEFAIGRKPKTESDIIDECDEFLDGFSSQRTINLERLQNTLNYLIASGSYNEGRIMKIGKAIKEVKEHPMTGELVSSRKIAKLSETPVYDLIKVFLEEQSFEESDEESYIADVEETARIFEEVLNETYVMLEKQESEKGIIINLVTTNLARKFLELVNNNKVLVLMSGTLHSEDVLKNVFGVNDFEIVEAETQQQGEIKILRTGLEFNCKYPIASREKYLKALDKCVELSKKPALVHVNAYSDMPSERELIEFSLGNLISKEKLIEMQKEDKESRLIDDFKAGNTEVLFTTRCARGVDFPGSECNSIIFTKYPNPSPEEAFWKVLKQTHSAYYWNFYHDKAKRTLLQGIYRGLRFKGDNVYLLSPDERVLNAFENQ